MYLATSSQLKRYDQALLDSGYSIEELVDKASDCLIKHFNYHKVLIVCGPGNNGADGISLGIKLFKQGKDVLICLCGKKEKLSKANAYYLDEALALDMNCLFIDDDSLDYFQQIVDDFDVIVDALFGFGLNSDLRGNVKYIVEMINNVVDSEIIAIDIPTGLNPDTGKPYNSCICATKTITLTAYKLAFLNPESELYTGDVILELLDAKSFHEEMLLSQVIDKKWAKYNLKQRVYDGHKGTYGKVLHITGCHNYRGAALLAAKAAVYAGSGMVSVCSNEKVIDALSINVPEATSIFRNSFNTSWFNGIDSLLIGSGLGLNEDSEELVINVLKNSKIPTVIDGDALTILAKHQELLETNHAPWVLTPHHGEFKRFKDFDNIADMVDYANEFARKYQVVLVLKGPNTLITDGYETYRMLSGNKGMSSAGMGDTLAGMISSFIGQGYTVKDGAILGTYLHGLCGDEVFKDNYTVVASKLIDKIPFVMKKLRND